MKARMESETRSKLDQVEDQAQAVLRLFFGTPDEPLWPEKIFVDPELKTLVNVEYLERAAGPFGRKVKDVETGLFRKHCTQCHGITGDGLGPAAALLSPYPRDFRRGTFKFKSTAHAVRPTLEDLIETIEFGLPGTSMPAMGNLKKDKHYADEIVVLAHYVRYLAIRGEVERQIMMGMVPELDLDGGESIYDPSLKEKDPSTFEKQKTALEEVVLSVARKWSQVQPSSVSSSRERIDVRSRDSNDVSIKQFLESARRGKELFRGTTAACSQCHGEEGTGSARFGILTNGPRTGRFEPASIPKTQNNGSLLKSSAFLSQFTHCRATCSGDRSVMDRIPTRYFERSLMGSKGLPCQRLPALRKSRMD